MHIQKKQYREFRKNNFVYMGAFEQQEYKANVEATDAIETIETPEQIAQKNLSPKIEAHRQTVEDRIKRLRETVKQPGVESFFDQMQFDVDVRFHELTTEYELARKEIGEAKWEDSRQERQIVKRAEILAQEIINHDLDNEKAISDAVQQFLEKMPNTEAKPDEKKLIRAWILETDKPGKSVEQGNLVKLYGTKDLDDIIDLIAQKYDIRFQEKQETVMKDGKEEPRTKKVIVYGADILNNRVYPGRADQGQMNLKEAILEDLKIGGPFSAENIRLHEFQIVDHNQEIDALKKEISRGSARALGGKINEWTDWENHRGVKKLMEMNAGMEGEIQKAIDAMPRWEMQDKLEEKRMKRLDQYNEFIKTAGLEQKFKDAEAKGYHHVEAEEMSPKPKEDQFEGRAVLVNEERTSRITVEVDEAQRIVLKVKGRNPTFETERVFTDPNDFAQIDLVAEAESQISNYQRNKDVLDQFDARLNESMNSIKELKIDMGQYTQAELASPDFALKPATLVYNDQIVGELTILDDGSYAIEMKGKEIMTVLPDKVTETLKGQTKEMKEISERAERAKTAITEQAQRELPTLQKQDGLEIKAVEPTGDFADAYDKILVGEIVRSDGSVAGKLFLPVSFVNESGAITELEGDRNYILETFDGTTQPGLFTDEINNYLEANKETLAKLPEKSRFGEALTGTPEQIVLKEKVRERFKDFIKKDPLAAEIVDEIKNDEQALDIGLNFALNLLPESCLQRFAEADDLWSVKFTPEEQEEFRNNFIKKIDSFIKEGNDEMPSKEQIEDNPNIQRAAEEVAKNPEMVKTLGEKGALEWIISLIQSVPIIYEYLERGDYQSAIDAGKAIQEHPDGIEGSIAQARKAYEIGIAKASFKELLLMHRNWKDGKTVETYFPTNPPFKAELPMVIESKIAKMFSKKAKVESWNEDDELLVKDGNRLFEIKCAEDIVEIGEVIENTETKYTSYPIEAVTGIGRTLESAIAKAKGAKVERPITPASTPEPTSTPK